MTPQIKVVLIATILIIALLSFSKFVIFSIGVLAGAFVVYFLKGPIKQLKRKFKIGGSE